MISYQGLAIGAKSEAFQKSISGGDGKRQRLQLKGQGAEALRRARSKDGHHLGDLDHSGACHDAQTEAFREECNKNRLAGELALAQGGKGKGDQVP